MEKKDRAEERDEERYREEARHARPVTPEYQGERLIFDELRNEPAPTDRAEESEAGPFAAPVEEPETKQELFGEGVGGASGAVLGAAVGSLGGPLGAAIGAIAGAVGGWWAGRAVVDVASGITAEEDQRYREHYERSGEGLGDIAYEDVRHAYHLGQVARANPDYAGRPFEEIERELERGWTEELRRRPGEWVVVRRFVRAAYSDGGTMQRHEEHDSHLVPNDPAYTASREESERVRSGEAPAPRVGGAEPGTAASIGGAAGGAALGAGMGTILGGPIGTIIGVIAGSIGGWWAGQGVAAAAHQITPELEEGYRTRYESSPDHLADRSYESIRHAYLLGYLARRNPEYQGKSFDAIEPELERGWTQDLWSRYGDWAGLRGYVRAAYEGDGRP